MGAKQRAQNRGKKAKGSMKGSPMSQKQLNQRVQVPSLDGVSRAQALQGWQSFGRREDNGFTMNQEARNTGRHVFGWSSTPLRNSAVSFVSAGTLTRDEAPEVQDAKRTEDKQEDEVKSTNEDRVPDANAEHLAEQQVPISIKITEPEPEVQYPVNVTEGIERNGIGLDTKDPAQAENSESDEEEILFTGRQNSAQPSRKPTPKPDTTKESVPILQKVAEPIPIPTKNGFVGTIATSAPSTFESTSSVPQSVDSRVRFKKHLFKGSDDEAAIMQDYIDNMALDDSDDSGQISKPKRKNEHFRFHQGSGLENAKVQTLSYSSKRKSNGRLHQAVDWDSEDLEDFDDLSTTDEEMDEVSHIIRHRERTSGPQYLVVGVSGETGDAKWVLHKKLISESAINEIKIYEEIRTMNVEEDDYDDEDDDSDSGEDEAEEALQDLIDNIESEDNENERIFKHKNRMTDSQIARALAKQEELGMGSDDLILFNGEIGEAEDMDDDDELGLGNDFIPFSSNKRPSRSRRKKQQRDSFPPAEAFADALEQDPYGAFDIMDFERPSLRPKKKGRKSDYPDYLDAVEDEDLRQHLVNTWTKDREKKATRKREKEEARLTATLDAADDNDPTVIKHRIRQFLVHNVDTLKLSPMESNTRAAVHRLAKALKLNSRSEGREGVGIGRYPVLTKTARTPSYSINNIWEIDAMMNTKRFFPKNSFKSSKLPRGTGGLKGRRGGGGGGGGVMSGATYKDGEEVAGSAPEIGADNRGRAMLEKMGWSAGMGIGKIGNEGSIDPIRHIVKTTKAGLG